MLRECLIKLLKRKVKTPDLYRFTQIDLGPIPFTQHERVPLIKNLITKQVFCPATSGYTSILLASSDTILDSS